MKRKNLILAVLAIVLVLCASIGAASAYFTTYADAKGGHEVHMKDESKIDEEVVGNVKQVTISNVADPGTMPGTYPVFVRARVFAGNDVNVVTAGENWEARGGYYYYLKPIYSALEDASTEESQTKTLNITVTPKENSTVRPGDPIDVLVTYESVPAVFTANGDPDFDTSWSIKENIQEIGSTTGGNS